MAPVEQVAAPMWSWELLHDGDALIEYVLANWKLVLAVWAACNAGCFVLLAQIQLFRKRWQRQAAADAAAEGKEH